MGWPVYKGAEALTGFCIGGDWLVEQEWGPCVICHSICLLSQYREACSISRSEAEA